MLQRLPWQLTLRKPARDLLDMIHTCLALLVGRLLLDMTGLGVFEAQSCLVVVGMQVGIPVLVSPYQGILLTGLVLGTVTLKLLLLLPLVIE